MWKKWPRSNKSEAGSKTAPDETETPRVIDEFEAKEALDNDVEPDPADGVMQSAFESLRGQHLASRSAERGEERELEELRLEILTAVTASPDLEDYYHEAWLGTRVSDEGTHRVSTSTYRRVAVMQIELMLRAFYLLQLQLFANAIENRGWMTLFRSWGRSSRFNAVFDELAPTLDREFAAFYETYIRELPTHASASGHLPIHHPWLRPAKGRGRGLFMDSGRMEPEIELRPGAGGVVDQRGTETPDQPFETPSDSPDGGGSNPPPNR